MLDHAVAALERGEVIVIPTDTVYGVAALLPFTARLFAVKERPTEVALPVLVADRAQAETVAVLSERAAAIADEHWPGGLTIVAPRARGFDADLGGDDASTVGVRVPDHEVPRELARRVGPLVTTSANLHGRPTPPTAAQAAAQLGVDVWIEGGVLGGAPSTVVRVIGSSVEILRQGAVQL